MGRLSLLGAGNSGTILMPNDHVLLLDAAIDASPSLWLDQSGFGNNASQGNGSYQPTYEAAGILGQPCMNFNLSYMNFNNFYVGSNLTFFIVFSESEIHNNCFLFPNQSVLEDKYVSQADNKFFITNDYIDNVLANNTPVLMSGRKGGAPGDIFRNNVYIGSTEGRNDETIYSYIGTVPGSVGIFRLAYMRVYNYLLSDGEITATNKFIGIGA